MTRVCIVGASGKLGQHMVQHALVRGYEVVGVCRERSVGKLDPFKGRITVIPGATNDREVIRKAVSGCDGVLTVLVPWGVHQYSSGTAQAVLDHARPGARLIFSCGWHITLDGQDVYSRNFKAVMKASSWFGRLFRVIDIDDQVEACRRVFASDTRWTAFAIGNLASVALELGDYVTADRLVKESLHRYQDLGFEWELALTIGNAAGVAAGLGQPECSIRLAGASTAHRERIGVSLPPVFKARFERMIVPARRELDETAQTLAWEEGMTMTLQQAVECALDNLRIPS